jgi:cytochrome P450
MSESELAERLSRHPVGAAVTVAELTGNPHPALMRVREVEPSPAAAAGGWLVTRAELARRVLRELAGFTVDDPRFTTAHVAGPSMLSLSGIEHQQHRDPFAALCERATRAGLADRCRGWNPPRQWPIATPPPM